MQVTKHFRGKRVRKDGKYYIFVQDATTGRIRKGTNKKWSPTRWTVDKWLNKLEPQFMAELVHGFHRIVVAVKYTPRNERGELNRGRKHHAVVTELQIDVYYTLENESTAGIRQEHIELAFLRDLELKAAAMETINDTINTENIPWNDIELHISECSIYSGEYDSITVVVLVRGREYYPTASSLKERVKQIVSGSI